MIPGYRPRKQKVRERDLYNALRDRLYKKYPKVTVNKAGRVEGLIRILKLSTLAMYGEGGWMDMAIWVKGGYIFLIELKKKGEKLSDLQRQRRKELRAMDFHAYVYDDMDEAFGTACYEIDCALAQPFVGWPLASDVEDRRAS